MMDMFTTVSALEAFANGMQITAHNIANVSTNNFRAQSYHYISGPGDRGVDYVAHYGAYNRDVPPPPERPLAHDVNVHWEYTNNTVDLPREMVNMILDQRAFEANATVIRTYDELYGPVIDLIV